MKNATSERKGRAKAMREAIAAIEKQFGRGAIMALGEREVQAMPKIPSGSPSLDAALGIGGYPRGRVIEIYGPRPVGKRP